MFTKSTKINKGRGSRALLAIALSVILIIGAAGTVFAAVPSETPAGIYLDQDRTLTIVVKDDVQQSTYEANFGRDANADALTTSSGTYNFKITKLEPASPGGTIVPKDKTTWQESATQVAYVQTDSGEVELTIPGPYTFDNTQGTEIALDTGLASVNGTSYAANAAPLQALVDSAGEAYADGVYLIEEVGGANNPGWSTVVAIPTVETALKTGHPNPMPNYSIFIYPKVKQNLETMFNSYVSVTERGRLILDFEDWGKDNVTKGEENTYMASAVLNGFDNKYTALSLGFGFFDERTSTIDNANMLTSSPYSPGLSVTKNPNKTMTVADNVELGVIISNTGSRRAGTGGAGAFAQYIGFFNTSLSNTSSNLPSTAPPFLDNAGFYSHNMPNAENRIFADATKHVAFVSDGSSFKVPAMPNSQANLVEAIAHAINNAIPANGDLGPFANLDLSGFNTQNYSNIEDIFSSTSNIKIEFTVKIRASIAGSGFRANDTTNDTPSPVSEAFRPFLYGSTINNGTGPTSDDMISFGVPTAVSGDVLSSPSDLAGRQRVDTYAEVETGAINAIKVDTAGAPLAGAKFAFKDMYGNWATAWTDADGPTFSQAVTPDSTYSNVYTLTTGPDGKVSFDGIRFDPKRGYEITEVEAPTGYQLLSNSIDTQPVMLSYADHLAAAQQSTASMLNIVNAPELALPNTGGPGMWILLGISTLLILSGVLLRRRMMRNAVKVQ